jgi:DNA-binding NarL/FixJ family response regulator
MTKTLLLVDDHPMFRRGVKELIINQGGGFDTVLEADDGHDALDRVRQAPPDYIVLDIAMPGIDGLETLETIMSEAPQSRCIILSMYNNPEFVIRARQLGARGYILKTDPDAVILDCLQTVEQGGLYISSAITRSVDPHLPPTQVEREDFDRLSKREKEILLLISRNHTSKEIAQQFSLSLRTIQNHRLNICKKLGISGPNALLKTAIEHQAWLGE